MGSSYAALFPRLNLGLLLVESNRLDEAVTWLEKAADLDPAAVLAAQDRHRRFGRADVVQRGEIGLHVRPARDPAHELGQGGGQLEGPEQHTPMSV